MTSKENILSALRQTLKDIFCRNVADDERENLERMINSFVLACESNLSAEDIIEECSTQEKLINLFNGFMEMRSEENAPTLH